MEYDSIDIKIGAYNNKMILTIVTLYMGGTTVVKVKSKIGGKVNIVTPSRSYWRDI